MSDQHQHLLNIVKKLPSDYKPWGEVIRWKDENKSYPDCSGGCKHYLILEGGLGYDWGVCSNEKSPRCGILTFEHQAGFGCFEPDESESDFDFEEEKKI